MLYELRHYDAYSTRELADLIKQFQIYILPIWARLGIEAVGFWPVIVGTPSIRLTYLLVWDDLGQREKLWDQFNSDPEYQALLEEGRKKQCSNPIHTITSIIVKPTDFSKLPRRDNQPSRLTGGVYELRTYSFSDLEKHRLALEWFAKDCAAHLEKHKMYVMATWTTYIGVAPRLTYMLVFESLAHRERAWAAFYTDPAWPAMQDGLYPDGVPLITGIENCLMKGSDFSGWR